MPRLSDAQFQNYEFRARRDFGNNPTEAGRTEVSVVKRIPGSTGVEPVGAMEISRPEMEQQYWEQYQIDKENLSHRDIQEGWGGHAHGQMEEPGGQQRWSGGTMEPREPDRVSYLGTSEDAPKTVLRGLMALGVTAHGSMPVADYHLTAQGSEISQGAARKYGVQPHPKNVEMTQSPNVSSSPEDARDIAASYWAVSENTLRSEAKGVYPVHDPSRRWQSFSAAQVHGITQHVEKNLLGRGVDARVPVHPSQQKLF